MNEISIKFLGVNIVSLTWLLVLFISIFISYHFGYVAGEIDEYSKKIEEEDLDPPAKETKEKSDQESDRLNV